MAQTDISDRQRSILQFIDETIRDKGFPPTVREIGQAVGLNSPASVHTHLSTLQERVLSGEIRLSRELLKFIGTPVQEP